MSFWSSSERVAGALQASGAHVVDPCLVLGIEMHASDGDVRSWCRRGVRKTRPDRLIGRGVSEEFVKSASDRLASLSKAYAQICAERGI